MSDTELIPLLCLLALWAGCTSAQEIRPGPGVVNVPEGGNALLLCAQASGQSVDEFDWRKDNGDEDKKEVFMYKKGAFYGNGLPAQNQDQQFKGRVEFFQHELKSGNASILIKNTRLEDNGTYTCGLGLDMYKRQKVHIRLNIGAAPLPYINQIPAENGKILLECKTHGVPKPELQWRDNTGEVLSDTEDAVVQKDASEPFSVQLSIKVTRSDTYICVVTQRGIFHQINNTAEVRIQDFVAVSEGEDAVLPCSVKRREITERPEFSWSKDNKKILFYDRGRVEEDEQFTRVTLFQQELKSGNASIKIHYTQKSDSGHYSCHFSNIVKANVVLRVIGNSGVKVQDTIHTFSFFVFFFLINFEIWLN